MTGSGELRVYWQPGCTSGLRTKEFLASRFVYAQELTYAHFERRPPAGQSDPPSLAAWHVAQHCRQLDYIVAEVLKLAPAQRLRPADLAGLPLPEQVWDPEIRFA